MQGLLNSDDKVVQCLLDHLTYLLTYLLRHDYEKHKGALEREVTLHLALIPREEARGEKRRSKENSLVRLSEQYTFSGVA